MAPVLLFNTQGLMESRTLCTLGECWPQPRLQTVPAQSQHSGPGEGIVSFENRHSFMRAQLRGGRLHPPHHSSSVHRGSMWHSAQPHPEQPCISDSRPCCHHRQQAILSSQTVHHPVTLGPCMRAAMSRLVSYCFSIAQSLGAKDSSLAVWSSQSILMASQEPQSTSPPWSL